MLKRFLLSAAVAAAVGAPTFAFAAEQSNTIDVNSIIAETHVATADSAQPLSLVPNVEQTSTNQTTNPANPNQSSSEKRTLTLDDTGGPLSKLHGFGFLSINSQYITPRGLVALESSPQFQILFGLAYSVYQADGFIEDISVNGGIWTDLNPHPDANVVTGADTLAEADLWLGFDVKFAKDWKFSYSIEAWTFPDWGGNDNSIDPTTEYNMQFKFSFDDSKYLKEFALHPYVNVFWNFSGSSSPVAAQITAQGKNNNTFYVELGIAPSYTYKGISEYPITFTFPTYFSVGDSTFWGTSPSGETSNFGVLSTGMKISVPLTFVPKDWGHWDAYIGFTYYNTLNPALTWVNSGTGADSNLVLGYAGLGFGF